MPLRDGELRRQLMRKSVRRRGSEVIFPSTYWIPDFHRLRFAVFFCDEATLFFNAF